MNIDSYYEIGAGHIYCQDYAYTAESKSFLTAIVCDGCSGSRDSDIGARFWAHRFLEIIEDAPSIKTGFQEYVVKALTDHKNLKHSLESYDATLVAVVYDKFEDTAYSFIFGDGKLIYRGKESHFLVEVIFKNNAPYYLTYHGSVERAAMYEQSFGHDFGEVWSSSISAFGQVNYPEASKKQVKFYTETYPNFSKSGWKSISVATDGIDTFHRRDDANVIMPKHEVINQLLAYKNTNGKFVERRMLAIKKYCEKNGWHHFDDIAIATISE